MDMFGYNRTHISDDLGILGYIFIFVELTYFIHYEYLLWNDIHWILE